MRNVGTLKLVKVATLTILCIAVLSIFSGLVATKNILSSWDGLQQQTPPLNVTSKELHAQNPTFTDQVGATNLQIVHDKITLVTQLSRDRLLMLKELIEVWSGPISAAVFLKKEQFSDLDRFLAHFPHRKNIVLTPYDSSQVEARKQYPVNFLRNLAWSQSTTPFVFLNDVDFIPTRDTLQNVENSSLVQQFVQEGGTLNKELIAFVIPAFRGSLRNTTVESKKEILTLLKDDMINPFGFQHHLATNYQYWETASLPYCVEPFNTDGYEPYVIVRNDAPRYDERFLGYGYNKVQQISHLMWLGYQFIVLPDAGIVHLPHIRSSEYMSEGDTENKKLYEQFQQELPLKHGPSRFANCSKLAGVVPFVPVES